MTEIQISTLKEAYGYAKVKSKKSDKDVVDNYLTQSTSMLSLVMNGKATSAPVIQGVVQFIHDVDPILVPVEFRHLVQLNAMEIVGEDS